MRNSVDYEWDIEAMDGEDIVDHFHSDALSYQADELRDALKAGTLVLVRTVGNEDDGVTDRTWAYVKDNALPERFLNAYDIPCAKVPQKFHNELKRRIAELETVGRFCGSVFVGYKVPARSKGARLLENGNGWIYEPKRCVYGYWIQK